MIYGQTHDEKEEAWKRTRRVYAWWPVTLQDGRRAWFEWVERFWWEDPSATWAGDRSCYKYRALVSGFNC